MLELFTLGSLSLRRDGVELDAVLTQPRRAALLCYLALAMPRGYQRRDTLLALFCPENDQQRGRAALRQAVYFLRRHLGDGVLTARGDEELAIGGGSLWSDAAAFQTTLEKDRPEEALQLYQGEFLKGFHVSAAPEFERWLDDERTRLRTAALQAAEQLFDAAEVACDSAKAVRWGRKILTLSPDDEGTARRLLALLERAGDRSGALREYEAFARRLATDYELEPADETKALAERIRVPRDAAGVHDRRYARGPADGPRDASGYRAYQCPSGSSSRPSLMERRAAPTRRFPSCSARRQWWQHRRPAGASAC